MVATERAEQTMKYLSLLSQQFPNQQSVFTEIINLQAILNLPKGTEHFMSDLHGEYEAFMHILNNCSGVIREHVDEIFGDTLSDCEKGDLCTLCLLYTSEGRIGRPREIGGRHVRKEEERLRKGGPEGLRKAHEARAVSYTHLIFSSVTIWSQPIAMVFFIRTSFRLNSQVEVEVRVLGGSR